MAEGGGRYWQMDTRYGISTDVEGGGGGGGAGTKAGLAENENHLFDCCAY